MQARETAVHGDKSQRPPCYGDLQVWGKTPACDTCPHIGSCKWCIDQGEPHNRQEDKWSCPEDDPQGELKDEKKPILTMYEMGYITHEILRTTEEEFEALIDAVKRGDTAGNEAAETIAKAIRGNEAIFLPLLDGLVAKRYRIRLERWSRGKRKKQREAQAYLEACERLEISPGSPEYTEQLKKGKVTIACAAILDVLELDNQNAAIWADLEETERTMGRAYMRRLFGKIDKQGRVKQKKNTRTGEKHV